MTERTIPTRTEGKAREDAHPAETREPSRYQAPPVDIYETDYGLAVLADLPGVASDGIDVRVDDNILTIQGRVRRRARGEARQSEFTIHDYYRQFQLSEGFDQERITAQMNHGVLRIDLPRHEALKPRKVAVKFN